jgi:glycosyltransferase involved in cell wall biosynthesis
MTKRIFFDGLNLALTRGTGVATYTRLVAQLAKELEYETGLLYSMRRNLPEKPLAREIAFFDDPGELPLPKPLRMLGDAYDVLSGFGGVKATEVPVSGAVVTRPLASKWVKPDHLYVARKVFDRSRAYLTLSNRLLDLKLPLDVDLFHWTYPLPIRSSARANIYTVHDIIPLRLPYTTLDWKRYYLKSMRAILGKADHIVTVSEHSKRDIMTYFGVDEKRITNTYQSIHIPERLLSKPEDALADELSGVFKLEHRNYLLFYGSVEPKKNLGRVVQSYLSSNADMPLVIIAAQSWRSDDEVRLLEQEVIQKRKKIYRYDYMPFPLLVSLIRGARAVLFPSLYEGFGLPVLEAMTLGTPVITSTEASVPEVAGDAALLVDPYDVDALTQAIRTIVSDDDLWADLKAKGLERAALFSLDAYRERMKVLYASYT